MLDRVSSSSSSFADYRAALTAPGALVPVLMSVLGRLPIAMIGLAILLYVQKAAGSFAVAGLVSAGALVGCRSVRSFRAGSSTGSAPPAHSWWPRRCSSSQGQG